MPKGIINEYDKNRGIGNIVDSLTGQKLIIYANFLQLGQEESLAEGQEVEYEVERRQGANWAINVRFLKTQNKEGHAEKNEQS